MTFGKVAQPTMLCSQLGILSPMMNSSVVVNLWLNVTLSMLKVIYHPLYIMNKFVTNKQKLPQDGAQVFSYMG